MSEYNFCGILCGGPGCGKTTLAGTIVRQHLEAGGVVFVHDPVQQFAKFGCQVYANADAWREAAKKAAELAKNRDVAHDLSVARDAWIDGRLDEARELYARHPTALLPRGASLGGSDQDVTRLALEIGEKCNRASSVRVRILKVADEMSLGESGSTWMDRLDNELLAIRRHRGIGILMNIQQPSQLTERFWSFCTDACLFQTTRDRAARLDKLLLLNPGELERAGVAELPRFSYVHVKLGAGIVREPLRAAA